MVLSAVAAWKWPFGLFLFAYAVLGPLHYLTEISWLHERRWMGRSRWAWILPTLAAIGATAAYFAGTRSHDIPAATVSAFGRTLSASPAQLMTLLALGYGFSTAFARSIWQQAIFAVGVVVAGVVFVQAESGRLLVGVFLVTIVHVLLFTSAFMLLGALRARSVAGYITCAVHLAIPAAMLIVGWHEARPIQVTSGDLHRTAPFHEVLLGLCQLFGVPQDLNHATAAMRVVAYAYTYHYLNWFSKAEVIRWHAVPVERLGIIVALWLASMVLYAVDWQLGFVVLLALSVAHVYLEFPLNWRTLAAIGGEMTRMAQNEKKLR